MAIKVTHVTPLLSVFDMPSSLRFYRDLLGFEVSLRSGPGDDCGWVALSLDETYIMLNTAFDDGHRPPDPDLERRAAHHDTILYFGCPNVDAAYAELSGLGLAVSEPEIQSYGMKQIYLHDPDGYNLCFQWRATPESTSEAE